MEIIEEEVFPPTRWIRWSDQCAAQFRSRFVVENLLKTRERVSSKLTSVAFSYFESHEGKNLSDTIGGILKQAYARATGWISGPNDGVGNDGDSAHQPMVIADQIKERMMQGLTFVDGRVGSFAFLR